MNYLDLLKAQYAKYKDKTGHKTRMQQASFVPKPGNGWWRDAANPVQMGEHLMQKKHSQKRKKKR
jgi:hypothetical protein